MLVRFGDWIHALMLDVSWDMKYLYSSDSANFVPIIATLFSRFVSWMRGMVLPLRKGTGFCFVVVLIFWLFCQTIVLHFLLAILVYVSSICF